MMSSTLMMIPSLTCSFFFSGLNRGAALPPHTPEQVCQTFLLYEKGRSLLRLRDLFTFGEEQVCQVSTPIRKRPFVG